MLGDRVRRGFRANQGVDGPETAVKAETSALLVFAAVRERRETDSRSVSIDASIDAVTLR